MVKTGSNFIVKHLFLWSKLSFLLSRLIFHVQAYKFSWSRNILVTNFLVNLHSIPTPFHSNFMLNSVPFQQHFMVSHDFVVQWQSRPTCTRSQPRLPAYHRYRLSVHWEQLQYFTDDVGSRVIRQVSWILEPVEQITCNISCLHNLSEIGEIVATEIQLHPSYRY